MPSKSYYETFDSFPGEHVDPLLRYSYHFSSFEGSAKNCDGGNAVEICPGISEPNDGDHDRQEFPGVKTVAMIQNDPKTS